VSRLLLLVNLLHLLELRLLLASIVLKNRDSFTHLVLNKHVVLHATLEDFCRFSALLSNPARIALFVQISEGHLINIEKYVVNGLIRVINRSSLIIEVERTNGPPIDALLLIELKFEIAVAQNVVLIVDDFDFSLFEIVSRFSHYFLLIRIQI
jgi:hypothetical protein